MTSAFRDDHQEWPYLPTWDGDSRLAARLLPTMPSQTKIIAVSTLSEAGTKPSSPRLDRAVPTSIAGGRR